LHEDDNYFLISLIYHFVILWVVYVAKKIILTMKTRDPLNNKARIAPARVKAPSPQDLPTTNNRMRRKLIT
jgi:hypothetical protein